MKIRVDADLCQGHGVCAAEAPEVFELAGDGPVAIRIDEPPEQLRGKVQDALRYCPTGAISVEG